MAQSFNFSDGQNVVNADQCVGNDMGITHKQFINDMKAET